MVYGSFSFFSLAEWASNHTLFELGRGVEVRSLHRSQKKEKRERENSCAVCCTLECHKPPRRGGVIKFRKPQRKKEMLWKITAGSPLLLQIFELYDTYLYATACETTFTALYAASLLSNLALLRFASSVQYSEEPRLPSADHVVIGCDRRRGNKNGVVGVRRG